MTEFLRPRLIGPRFDQGKVPLEMLSDLAVLRELIMEVAKWRYLEANPSRKRSARGFADGVSITLTGIDKGSAIPIIDVEFHHPRWPSTPQLPGMPGHYERYFNEARDSIIDAIAAAETNSLTEEYLPEKCLAYFDRIGRGLRGEDSIEFISPARSSSARLTKESRRRLVLASRISEMTDEVRLRGYIPEADQDRMSFELLLLEGKKVSATMDVQHQEIILDVFNGYKGERKA